mmetsp:Transcript_130887/g.195025  ORF Transcript_130887/g.195025 Transcript_130887/m.195025 type:complete len:215 (+) Transcript_130887:123-767(+)
MADLSESEFDFLQGSMKDLAMKMGEIDDVLAEITAPEETKNDKEKEEELEKEREEKDDVPEAPIKEESVLATVNTSYVDVEDTYDDDSDDDGDDDGGLTDLQGELRQFEEMDKTHQLDAVMGGQSPTLVETPITVIVHKPSPTSPLGISMKTSKGITRIVGLSESGLLSKTELREGQLLVKINGIYIKNAKHARYIIQNATNKVILEAKQVSEQ